MFSGIVSGMDTQNIVRQLVSLERQPIRKLESKQADYRTQLSTYGKLSSKMSELSDLLEGMDETATLLATSASSSDEDVVGVTSTGDAPSGTFEVEVGQLARAERNQSATFADANAEVSEGTLTIEVFGEDAVDVAIDAGATLADVRDAVNASGAEVSASIINTDAGSILSVTSLKEGHAQGGAASDAVVLTENTTGGSGQALGLTEAQTARRAEFTLDGIAISSETNEVKDAIAGITLNLKETTSEPVRVSVTKDTEKITEQLNGVVNKYNEVENLIDQIGEEDASFARNAKRTLKNVFSNARSSGTTEFANLSAIGLTTNPDTGGMRLDATKLEEALEKDGAAVADLFLNETNGAISSMVSTLETYTRSFDGLIALSEDTIDSRIDTLDSRIDRKERRVDAYEERMRAQFTAMESFMQEMSTASMRISSFLPA